MEKTEKKTAEEMPYFNLSKNKYGKMWLMYKYDKAFLNWIYERMICVHGEKDLYDYMLNFKAIIDRVGSEHDKARNQAIQDCIDIVSVTPGDENVIPKLESLKTIS